MSELIGKTLEGFELPVSTGGTFRLPQDLLGKWTVLYFYPKDDTPGCTVQACAYRDAYRDFEEIDAQVVGVSGDDLESHDAFINKFELNFPLLADIDHRLSTFLGVFGDQEWQGKVYQGISRDTFLIDPQGIIRRIWRKVDPKTTVAETKQALQQLRNS